MPEASHCQTLAVTDRSQRLAGLLTEQSLKQKMLLAEHEACQQEDLQSELAVDLLWLDL